MCLSGVLVVPWMRVVRMLDHVSPRVCRWGSGTRTERVSDFGSFSGRPCAPWPVPPRESAAAPAVSSRAPSSSRRQSATRKSMEIDVIQPF